MCRRLLNNQAANSMFAPRTNTVSVVTDTGSIGSHASQVAREFGIPAVVCTENATSRLRPGQLVTVDGNAGVVEPSNELITPSPLWAEGRGEERERSDPSPEPSPLRGEGMPISDRAGRSFVST